MADLVRVRFTDGNESKVSRAWLTRWPEDIEEVLNEDFAPVGEEQTVAVATELVAPTGDKKKEK